MHTSQNIICLLLSLDPDDRSLVAAALRPEFPRLEIRQLTDAQGWQQALAGGGFQLAVIAEPIPWEDKTVLVQALKTCAPECPVILLAGPESREDAWKALQKGLDDYVLRDPEHLARFGALARAALQRTRHRLSQPPGEGFPRKGEDAYRSIFAASEEIIIIYDPESGRILDANQEAWESFGYGPEEIKALDLWTLGWGGSPPHQEKLQQHLKRTLEEGPQTFQWLGQDRTGKPLWLEITSKPLLIDGQRRIVIFGANISRYKRAQEALREAERRYKTLVDSAGDAIFINDTAGRLVLVNDTACKLLGYKREELQEMSLKDIDAPSHASLQKRIRDAGRGGQVFVKTALKRRDGVAVPVEMSSRLIEYSGLPVVFNIARDITERCLAEERLRFSETKYRTIFENTGAATCIVEEDTTFCLVNEEFARLAGCTREELEGKKSWTEFIIPEDLERLKEYHSLRRLDPQAAPRNYTFRFQDRQGQIKDILATVAVIPGTAKSVVSLLDITARERMERELRESEVRYRLLVETMNDGLGMVDEKGVFTFVSGRLCEMLGYVKAEMLRRPLTDFLDAANKQVFQTQLELRRRGGREPYELSWLRKDGAAIITSVSPVPLFDAGDSFKGAFAVVTDITPRKEAERILRESEEKYRTIFENTGAATLIVEEDTTISLVNAEFAKLSGYAPEELEGKKSWTDFFAAEDLGRMQEYHRLRRIDPSKAPRNYEARFVDRQGEIINLLLTVAVIPGTRKSVGSLLDITARKKAEQELDFERNKFQTLAENSPFAMVMIGADGAYKYVSPKFTELFGYEAQEVPDGRTWFRKAFPDPAYRREVISSWVNDLPKAKPGERRPRTYAVTCKDGSEKIISFISVQLDNGDYLMTCEDVTEQHRAAEAVKRSEQHFRLLIENSMYHLRIIDPQGIILYESPTLDNFLGYTPAEMVGRNAFELAHPDDLAAIRENFGILLEIPGSLMDMEMRYLHKDGSWRYLEVKGKNLLQEPVIRGIVLSARDVSEAKSLRSQLLQSQKMEAIGTLAGGIAHDFNNILFPILVNTEMVLESLPLDSPSRQRLDRVVKSCERARDLVRQILAFSRHEERELKPLRLIPIIEESLRLLRASLPTTIEMRQNLSARKDIVLVDPIQVQQILINLYTNAAHALGDKGGVIEIGLTEAEAKATEDILPKDLGGRAYLRLSVRDNGRGMDPVTMERIFDPYFTTKNPGEGTGLGLAVVHGLVKRHGGAIMVESEPGRGSCFNIFLPRLDAAPLPEPRELSGIPRGKGRILVVDDEAEILEALHIVLENMGYLVVGFTSGVEALDFFRTHQEGFDLVITDQTMPRLTGEDLAREILALRPGLPVILCTGFSEAVPRERALALGIREIVTKPVFSRELARVIQRALAPGDIKG